MGQNFRDRLSQIKENSELGDEQPQTKPEAYPAASDARHLCFAWPDGRRQFLNYAYLVSCAFSPADSAIIIHFTTHVITLKGYRLDALFDTLMQQLPRLIVCIDERYNELQSASDPVVNEMTSEEK